MRPTDKKANNISWLMVLAGLTLWGCTDAPVLVDELGQRESAIINGSLDVTHPAVGALHSGNKAACTATLVGTRTVLTAAHCVLDADTGALLQPVNFYLGGFPGGTKYTASSVVTHPAYAGGNQSDLAVVRLSQDVQGVQPMQVASSAPQSGETVLLVGYGLVGENSGEFGTKRKAANTIGKMTSTVITFYGAGGTEGNLCNGDSGGPTFANRGGKEVMIGVHSTKGGVCGQEGHDMRVDAFYGWISGQAQGNLYTGGPADQAPPQVKITKPTYGDVLGPVFNVEVKAFDDVGVTRVALFLDGKKVGERTQQPFAFQVQNVAVGAYTLEAVAFDQAGHSSSATAGISVQSQGATPPPPPPSEDPQDSENPATPSPGTYGASCGVSGDCQSGLCALDTVTGQRFCTALCDLAGQDSCPGSAVCQPTGDKAVCAPLHDLDGDALDGGCSVGGKGSAASGLWLLLGLGLLLLRSSRSRRR
jgi:MYXO-CTERM domain-containing protein